MHNADITDTNPFASDNPRH